MIMRGGESVIEIRDRARARATARARARDMARTRSMARVRVGREGGRQGIWGRPGL